MKNGNDAAARVITAFEKLGVDYLLAGSFSSNFYGIPRSTKDADFVAVLSGKVGTFERELGPEFQFDDQPSFETVTGTFRDKVRVPSLPFEIEIFPLIAAAPAGTEAFCHRTSAGAEIDLVLELRPGKRWAFECKRSLTPTPARGFHEGCKDLKPERKLVIYPGTESYPRGQDVECVPLLEAVTALQKH